MDVAWLRHPRDSPPCARPGVVDLGGGRHRAGRSVICGRSSDDKDLPVLEKRGGVTGSRHRHRSRERPATPNRVVYLGRGGRGIRGPALDPAAGRENASIPKDRQRALRSRQVQSSGSHPRSGFGVVALGRVQRLTVARAPGDQHRAIGERDRHRIGTGLKHGRDDGPAPGRRIEDRGRRNRFLARRAARTAQDHDPTVAHENARGRPYGLRQRAGPNPCAVAVGECWR